MGEKISIIVPIYNAETTLDRCIDALIKQTYQNIEIILVNDGSKDNSGSICHRYADRDNRIIVIDKENGGVSAARNAGLDVASGEYVMFCDSDDWAEPEWCEELILNYSEDCLMMCGVFVEGKQSSLPYKVCAKNMPEIYERIDIQNLKLKFFSAPWNKLFSRKVIEEKGIRFNAKISNGEDYLFNIQYINNITGKIIFLPGCVFHYVWPGSDNLSMRISEDFFVQCEYWAVHLLNEAKLLVDCNPDRMRFYYTEIFNQFQRGITAAIENVNLPSAHLMRRLNTVMSSNIYQECVHKTDCISEKRMYLWKMKKCYGVCLLLELHKLYRRN